MNLGITKTVRTLAAGATSVIDAAGTFLQFSSNTGSFNFSIDGGPFIAGFSVLSIPIPKNPDGSASTFKQIILQDTSGSTNTITIITANGPVSYSPAIPTSITQNAPTTMLGGGELGLADGAHSALYSGVNASGKARKVAIIGNLGSTQIYITDAAGNLFDVLQPITNGFISKTALETSSGLYVYNTAGSGAGVYTIGEIFYQ